MARMFLLGHYFNILRTMDSILRCKGVPEHFFEIAQDMLSGGSLLKVPEKVLVLEPSQVPGADEEMDQQ